MGIAIEKDNQTEFGAIKLAGLLPLQTTKTDLP